MKTISCITGSASAWLVSLALAMNFNALAADSETSASDISPRALLSAHAHNDYEHPHPLYDALAQGFNSVEADIWLVDGRLLVAHNLADVKPERTLEALYLNPLRERIRLNDGHVFTNAKTFNLMIDVKSDAEPTYTTLRKVLRGYTNILTTFTATNISTNALAIILTGNRAIVTLSAEPQRYVSIDGRFTDLNTNISPQLMPLISENWTKYFKWRGVGSFPEAEQRQLRTWVDNVHREGRRIRFWAIPDNEAGWRELQAAGVDLINTDNLAGLAKFLQSTKR